MTKQKDSARRSLTQEIKAKKGVSGLYFTLRFFVIVTLVLQFFNRNFENVFLCILTLVLLLVPTFIERKIHIDLPNTLEIIIMLFIFAAEILGEIQSFYITYPYWDVMLHTLNGFLCAAIGFSLVDILNRHKRFSFSLSPLFMALVAFCFSMTIGVLWEFFEFAMDNFLLFDMQKDVVVNAISTVTLDPAQQNMAQVITGIEDVILVFGDGTQRALGLGGYLDIGLIDTMDDMFVNFIGAVVFSFFGYFYVKTRGKGKFARRFIPQVTQSGEASASSTAEHDSPAAP